MELKKILIIFGTRPEAIKMAPVVAEFQRRPECEVKVCFSGQHREMVEQVLEVFGLVPDFDLAVMKKGQTLTEVTTGVLAGMKRLLEQYAPDMVLVQGDTTTVLGGLAGSVLPPDSGRACRGRIADGKPLFAVSGRNEPVARLPAGDTSLRADGTSPEKSAGGKDSGIGYFRDRQYRN